MTDAITTLERATDGSGARWHSPAHGMINYTDHIVRLMADVIARVPDLTYIDLSRVLVFARLGRSDAEGAYATCHALGLPSSEPSYYFWRDRRTGQMTRRSEWFVTKSPMVEVGSSRIDYLISFCLPRFCDQTLARAQKEHVYSGAAPWVAKLDTIVHELYHVDPSMQGIRKLPLGRGRVSTRTHSPQFFRDVARLVKQYLACRPDPALTQFLTHDFVELNARFGRVTGAAFRHFPSFPQRYIEVLSDHPVDVEPGVRVEQVKPPGVPTRYTAADLAVREFSKKTSRRVKQAA
ncbi:MAG: hypothetical protein JJE40_20190 [Vicinamibacteria bacterium]|nr:hypothetical protein [Vicinamibacteria bacterium]